MKSVMWILLVVASFFPAGCDKEDGVDPSNPADSPYVVTIDPADFFPGDSITGNLYFPLSVGKTLTYEGEDEDGVPVTVEEIITDSIKTIMGVACRVVRAREYENDVLVEDTYDWYAQDRDGNVWYFGEDTHEIENGVPVNSSGSWTAGVDGALPGIIMLAEPLVGVWYRQEYYKGEAEDVAQVLSIGETLTVQYGTFTNCLRTLEYALLEPGVEENKIYAPGIGLLRAEGTKGEGGYEDLVSITP